MNMTKLSQGSFKWLAALMIAVLVFGCKSEGENVGDNADTAEIDIDLMADLNKAKQVFYSLPSPIETAMLMKRAGAEYDPELLNSLNNIANYNTNKDMALNLGVYGADLSFASMFDQSQASIDYMNASKQLAEDLGILNAIDNTTVERMETNVNNRDSLMDIISETFMNSNAFLKENDRPETAAIILVGGWVEGLYLASKIAKTTDENEEIKDRIIDQRLSLGILLSLMEEYKDHEDVANLLADLSEIKEIFDKVKVSTSKVEPVTDPETKITILKSTTETSYEPEVFDELCKKIEVLRNNIIK